MAPGEGRAQDPIAAAGKAEHEASAPPVSDKLQTSLRDDAELAARLASWLVDRAGFGPSVRIDGCSRPDANGMSSDTLMFDISWRDGRDVVRRGRYVARLRPADDVCPIFPTYELEHQVRVMRLVGERTVAPVPTVHWYEPDEAPLGAPFFVMDRVDGEIPPDVMPYTFDGSWVREASPQQRDRMEARTIDVLAAIHGAPVDDAAFLASEDTEERVDRTPLRRHFDHERAYYEWAREGDRFPVLERAFDWLEARWPERAEEAPAVVTWGDARIGNIVYENFEPRAVLDWEMATIAPRELDLAWFLFLHRFFEDLASQFGMEGLPDFLQRDRVVERYADRTGHRARDLDWFLVYAALRHGTVMTRAMRRRVFFGEVEMPDDPEELILHRETLESMIA